MDNLIHELQISDSRTDYHFKNEITNFSEKLQVFLHIFSVWSFKFEEKEYLQCIFINAIPQIWIQAPPINYVELWRNFE